VKKYPHALSGRSPIWPYDKIRTVCSAAASDIRCAAEAAAAAAAHCNFVGSRRTSRYGLLNNTLQ